MTITTMMRSARVHEFGDASVIRHDTVPRPRPAFGEVLVRVAATSFNPTEAALRAGMLQAFLPVDLPYTLGWDVAGTVAEIGAGARGSASATGSSGGSTAEPPRNTHGRPWPCWSRCRTPSLS